MKAIMWVHVLRNNLNLPPLGAYDDDGNMVSDLALYYTEAEAKKHAQRIESIEVMDPVNVVPVWVTIEGRQ